MENSIEDKFFLVVYKDDMGITKTKKLVYKQQDGQLVYFFNEQKFKNEVINSANIVRMEEITV